MIIWLYIKLCVTIKKNSLEKKFFKVLKKKFSSNANMISKNSVLPFKLKDFMKIISTLHWLFNFLKI